MFGSLRNKFQTVQEGISASIRGLTITEAPKQKRSTTCRQVNYNAGADVLRRFQLQWNELHELAEENAKKASEADKIISSIHEKLELEINNIICLNNTLAIIPKINVSIQNLMDQIGTLQELFEEVEGSLYQLEDLNETLDLQNKQLDHRFQLALYEEKKLAELNATKSMLKSEHEDRLAEHQLKLDGILEERREAFEEIFEQELAHVYATGELPTRVRSSKIDRSETLEEVLDVSEVDQEPSQYEKFLESLDKGEE